MHPRPVGQKGDLRSESRQLVLAFCLLGVDPAHCGFTALQLVGE